MSKLKYLIVMDPLQTESSEFWKNFGESNNVTPADIQTEVFRLPTTCFAEEDGSITNSGRWAQWHWKGCDQPGEALPDVEILSMIQKRCTVFTKKKVVVVSNLFEAMTWNYAQPHSPSSVELAKELNGYALADLLDADGNVMYKKVNYLTDLLTYVMMVQPLQVTGSMWVNGLKR